MATQEVEYSLESVVHGHDTYKYTWTPYLGERLCIHTDRGMHINCILGCFGDKGCEIVGHIQRINCSAMLAIPVYTLNQTLLDITGIS